MTRKKPAACHLKPKRTVLANTRPRGAATSTLKPRKDVSPRANGKAAAVVAVKPMPVVPRPPADDLTRLCAELQSLQRQRTVVLRSRIRSEISLRANVAGDLGYAPNLPEKERARLSAEAGRVIKAVAGECGDDAEKHVAGPAAETLTRFREIIRATLLGIDAFNKLENSLKKSLERLAGELPAAAWARRPEQRGFGMLSLATVVGECGDLRDFGEAISNHPDPKQRKGYSNPARVWRRRGCAPWPFDDKTRMGSTWRRGKEGKLPAAEWEEFGYSPRRRSMAFNIGECLIKLNYGGDRHVETDTTSAHPEDGEGAGDTPVATENSGAGPYRQRYLDAKAAAALNHPDWPPLRCHLHGMLLAVKRLLRDLWCVWNGKPAAGDL